MTSPTPDKRSVEAQDTLNALIDAFSKLPPLLGFGGLILIAAIVILSISGVLPDVLLAVPVIAIVAFLLYAYNERRFEFQTRQKELEYELRRRQQELEHEERMARARERAGSRQDLLEEAEEPEPNGDDENGDVSAEEWERRYLHHLIGLCGYPPSMALVDIKEAGLGGHKLALERIFTSLDVPAPQTVRDPSQMAMAADRREPGEREQREPALAALSREQNERLVLVGAPGSGKSTLVNYITLCLAGDHLRSEQVNQDHLREHGWDLGHLRLWPVRVILREYAARGLSKGQDVWEYIAADLSRPNAKLAGYVPHLKKRLEEEGGILLLDGLDEVDKATKVRENLKTNIELFARDFPKVRVVVTSRPYAYGSGWELGGFRVTRLLPFSEEQIEFFVEQWYEVMGEQDKTLGPEKAEAYGESLVRQIKQIHNLLEMAHHPLLLTMMVYIHRGREGGALPQRREELYRLCVILLLDLWRRSKTIPGRETQTLAEVLGMDTERLLEALAEVAYKAHRDQPEQEQTADISGERLAGTLFKYKGKESEIGVEEIIGYVRDRAGLLEDHGRNADDTDDVYRFPHRTFQEYLAAMHLLNKPDFPADIVKLARKDPERWREAVLLAGAAARPAMRWALVENLFQRRPPPPDGETVAEDDWWGVFLAGQVLAETDRYDDPPEMYRHTLSQVKAWHEEVVVRGVLPPGDRALAGQVLGALGDDRPGVGITERGGVRIPDIVWGEEVPPGTYPYQDGEATIERPYRLSRYPITNAQFQCFVEAEDRGDARWWRDIPEDEKGFSEPRFPYANHPRERVSWYQAVAFCRWLGDKLRPDLPEGAEIDLPREREWEVAARRPDGRKYPWGGEFDEEKANTSEGGIGQTTAVGLYPSGRNPDLELYDLSGNVWEWCRNKYNSRNAARVASRSSLTPDDRFFDVGFRVVLGRPPSHQDR